MDTRNKILSLADARRLAPARPLAMVSGYFDVIRAAHTRELEETRRRCGAASLLALVLPRADELVPMGGRLELVAALRAVDYVAAANAGEVKTLRESLKPEEFYGMEEADEVRIRELIDHIKRDAE